MCSGNVIHLVFISGKTSKKETEYLLRDGYLLAFCKRKQWCFCASLSCIMMRIKVLREALMMTFISVKKTFVIATLHYVKIHLAKIKTRPHSE